MGVIGIMPILSFSFHLKDCFPKAEVGHGKEALSWEKLSHSNSSWNLFEEWQRPLTFTINSSIQVSRGSCKVHTHTHKMFKKIFLLPSSFLPFIVLSYLTFLLSTAFHDSLQLSSIFHRIRVNVLFSLPCYYFPSLCGLGSMYYRAYIGEIFVT